MTVSAASLKSLHELHVQYFSLTEQVEKSPKLIKARQLNTQKKQDSIDAKKESLKQIKMESDRKNLELKSNESKIDDLKARLNIASSNKEFNLTKGQIDADTMANSVLEDEILELMEKADGVTDEIKALEAELETVKIAEAEFIKDQEEKSSANKVKIDQLDGEIKEAETVLPQAIRLDYRRVIETRGKEAMAIVEEGICRNCYVSLTAQNNILLNTGNILFCPSCGALLYREENQNA